MTRAITNNIVRRTIIIMDMTLKVVFPSSSDLQLPVKSEEDNYYSMANATSLIQQLYKIPL